MKKILLIISFLFINQHLLYATENTIFLKYKINEDLITNYDKRSFMSVEVTLFKKEPLLPINSDKMIPMVKSISEKIITDVFEKDENFKFFKRKS